MATSNNKSKKRVTSYDVAREAGVSQSAVSRTFRPGLSVSKKTRDKVHKAAKKLGYRPNAIARMLITQRSGMVAVIISPVSGMVYPELLSRITMQLSDRGLRVLLFTMEDASQLDQLLEQIWTFQVDGVLALTGHFDEKDLVRFEEHNIPVVLYNRQVRNHPANTVCVDHDQGLRQLVDLLVDAGHKSYLVLSGPDDEDVSNERRGIALDQLGRRGINGVPVIYGDYSYQSGKDCFAQWMKDNPAPDAVVCSNDAMAIGCIDQARGEYGISVPEDMSVIGFDGMYAAFWSGYELTTIRQPVNQMARAAVEILLNRIDDPELPPEKRVLAGQFVRGTSARG